MRRHPDVTEQPAPTTPASSLHRRLTVAFANAPDRARLVEVISTERGSRIVHADELLPLVDGLARERAASRTALRACLDTVAARTMHDCEMTRQELEQLTARRRTLIEGAEWATQLQVGLAEQLAKVESARDALDERRTEQRAAQQDLDKVLEQRKAAAAAIEDADRQLAEMEDLGMDEGGLRRELEAAGQAVQAAQKVHADAVAKLEELQLERSALAPDPVGPDGIDPAAVEAVRAALDALVAGMRADAVDPRAVSLASSWEDLEADMALMGGPLVDAALDELEDARRTVDVLSARLAEIDAAKAAAAITPDQRALLDAAHAAVQDATEQIERRGSSGARKRLGLAQEAERALLDEHGFGSYLEVVLTGGRAGTADPSRALIERELFDATRARDALVRQAKPSPELEQLRTERSRLLGLATDLLSVDPGQRVLPLLRAHKPVGTGLQIELGRALAAVRVRPVGVSLDQAARAFLESYPDPQSQDPAVRARAARSAALAEELEAGQVEVDRSEEALQMAERSVQTLENELSERSEADVQRMERYTGAQELRAQITSVAGTLRRAEAEARGLAERADQLVAAAEATFDQSTAEISALVERGRRLAAELPSDQRPDGDPLRNLPVLVEGLRRHAEVVAADIDRCEAAAAAAATQMDEAMAARRVAGVGIGPMPEDFVEALEKLFEAAPGVSLFVLDEPFGTPEDQARVAVLETVRRATGSRQIVLLTEDPEVLGWAIDLPPDEAAADPADALLARLVGIDDEDPFNSADDSVENIATMPDPNFEPAPTARRWAGQR